MKRKFSFDIPRLKIGPSKADTKALRDHLAQQPLESPPITPKSVRPPLSPIVEAELRASCAYVLHNFKPSHIVYEEPNAGKEKRQLDYAAIKESVHKDVGQTARPPISRVVSGIDGQTLVKVRTPVDVKKSVEISTHKSENASPARARYRREVAENMSGQEAGSERDTAQQKASLRAEQLMMSGPSKPPTPVTRPRAGSHLRSVSYTLQSSVNALMKTNIIERPRTAPRAASADTTGSTPKTDSSDCPWLDEKVSTAVTSVAITPARSKRASSQALQSGSEASSMPKKEPVHPDWMRQELEKHKKAQEERLHPGSAREGSDMTVDGSDTTPKQGTQAPTPVTVRIPARKPVPNSRSASRHEPELVKSLSRESTQISGAALRSTTSRTSSTQDVAPPRSNSTPYEDYHHIESQSALGPHKRSHSRARSITHQVTQQVKQYIRPSSTQRTVRAVEVSRPSSRSGSVTRQVKEYFRPGSAAGSRKPSLDVPRFSRRSHSIDSNRSATSNPTSPVDQPSNKWQGFKNFHRRNGSRDTANNSRPGTSSSTTDSRGRTATRDGDHLSEQQKTMTVNLNRDLPPLPGLDQWKDELSDITIPTAKLSTPVSERGSDRETTIPYRRSRPESKTFTLQPGIGEKEEIVAARMGSPAPPKSRKPSMDHRSTPPPQPTSPPPAPPAFSANMRGPEDFAYEYHDLTPTTSLIPLHSETSPRSDRPRSKTIQASYVPSPQSKLSAYLGQPSPETTPKLSLKRSGTFTTHLAQRVRDKSVSGRKDSKVERAAATGPSTPVSHSRKNSEFGFLRRPSMDSFSKMQGRYQKEMTAAKEPIPAVPVRDKKWWQRMGKKPPNSPSWMDAVVKSGSSSGILVQDEVAGVPKVRY